MACGLACVVWHHLTSDTTRRRLRRAAKDEIDRELRPGEVLIQDESSTFWRWIIHNDSASKEGNYHQTFDRLIFISTIYSCIMLHLFALLGFWIVFIYVYNRIYIYIYTYYIYNMFLYFLALLALRISPRSLCSWWNCLDWIGHNSCSRLLRELSFALSYGLS